MRWEQLIRYGSISDIGFRRRNNEDALIVQMCPDRATWKTHGHLFLVADGMGGHAVGELASKIAVDTLPQTFFKMRDKSVSVALKEALEVVNATINERGTLNSDFQRMGTTCSALVLAAEGAVIGHVGDSRVYRVRNDRIDQLTFDHSLQWELLRERKMSRDDILLYEPRHVITRSLGPSPKVKVDLEGPFPVLPGDIFVLCSDGLTGHVNDSEIGTIARELPPGDACRLLVHLANLRGGSDNISVVIADVGDVPPEVLDGEELQKQAQQQSYEGKWLGSYWAIAFMLVAGVMLLLFRRYVEGVLLVAMAVSVLSALVFVKFRHRLQRPVQSAGGETVLWNPYATGSARLSRKFLGHLAAVVAELQRIASEEGWPIDWPAHEQTCKNAKHAYARNEHSEAFRYFTKAIDTLMPGLHEGRKQLHREAKWGKRTAEK